MKFTKTLAALAIVASATDAFSLTTTTRPLFATVRPGSPSPMTPMTWMTRSLGVPTLLASTPTSADVDPKLNNEVERLKAMAAKLRQEAAELEAQQAEARAQALERAFEKFDTNHDGKLSLDELKAALEKTFKLDLTEERVERLLNDFDTSGDGKLQKNEMVSLNEFRNRLESLASEERQKAIEASKAAQKEAELTKLLESQLEMINDKEPTGRDKVVSVLPYLFPLMDGLMFGQYLLAGKEDNPLVAALAFLYVVYRSIPFSGFLAFFGLSAFSGNLSINRLVRFNMQQAIFLDVALFVPGVLGALASAASNGLGLNIPPLLGELSSDAVFVTLLAILGYSTVSSLLGKTPDKIPLISNEVKKRLPTADEIEFFDVTTGQPILRSRKKDEKDENNTKSNNEGEKELDKKNDS